MSIVRRAPAGATRTCPHCRAVILQSTSVCPSCRKHLRFAPGADGSAAAAQPSFSPLRVEGTIRHPDDAEAWEYAVMISIANERGEVVTRQVVGVGAIQPGAVRTFTFSVDVFTPGTSAPVDVGAAVAPPRPRV